jgi:nitroimidazol reductase NimA-like FMN-containing flavoprotein (pyridoxamine 5'-phosphate oxidase superfamily)
MPELTDIARSVIDANTYMALGTADATGVPWVTPVYYTPDGYTDFYWVSSPDALHSRNIAERADVSIAIYDSHSVIGGAEAVYMTAKAALVPVGELERSASLYSSRLPGLKSFGLNELVAPALFRLYRAVVTEHSILIRGSDETYGTGVDSRMPITIA